MTILDVPAGHVFRPGDDLSVDLWGENAQDSLQTCNPLSVEFYRVKLGITR